MSNKKGFTLIELLVVMGILGILMAVTILVINPAQYLARARDTQRINDLQAVNSAIATFMANGGSLVSTGTTTAVVTSSGLGTGLATTTTVNTIRATDNTGWVKGIILSGSGLSTLPIDPSNGTANTTYGYAYMSDGTDYELNANTMESTYYTSSPNDVRANDGGDSTTRYEVGSKLTLMH